MAEILGSSGTSTPISYPDSTSNTPIPPASSTSDSSTIPDTMHELTVSSKSVASYFKDKLALRSRSGSAVAEKRDHDSALVIKEELEAPRAGLGMKRVRFEDADFSAPERVLPFSSMSLAKDSSATRASIPTAVEAQGEPSQAPGDVDLDPGKPSKRKRKRIAASMDGIR